MNKRQRKKHFPRSMTFSDLTLSVTKWTFNESIGELAVLDIVNAVEEKDSIIYASVYFSSIGHKELNRVIPRSQVRVQGYISPADGTPPSIEHSLAVLKDAVAKFVTDIFWQANTVHLAITHYEVNPRTYRKTITKVTPDM